jgi:hypothetical protein
MTHRYLAGRYRLDPALLEDLVTVLLAHPGGLRRWTLMRAMRSLSEKANREITPRFEDDVERTFRHHCEGDSIRSSLSGDIPVIFFRPTDSVGEVWSVYADRVRSLPAGWTLS